MKKYNVTVSHTGGIRVEANSALEASKKVNSMKKEEIEKLVSFCDYEVTDVAEVAEPVYYYSVAVSGTDVKYFFRAGKEFADVTEVMEYLTAAKKIKKTKQEVFWTNYSAESDYREEIVSYLKLYFDKEREEYHKALKGLTVDDVISSAGKIQFYDDIIQLLDDRTNDDDFSLKEVEKLLDMEKPLDYLFEKNYVKIDFSSANEQMIGILNSEG